jgi:hypothetical protein
MSFQRGKDMGIQDVLQQLSNLSDDEIDGEIRNLESQLELLKIIRKKRSPTVAGAPRATAGKFEDCTIDRVMAVLEATGQGTTMTVRSNLPNCHHKSVSRCIEEGVSKGVFRQNSKGILTIAR